MHKKNCNCNVEFTFVEYILGKRMKLDFKDVLEETSKSL